MGNRYLITGVQLGLLSDDNIELSRKRRIINDILDKQFIMESKNNIEKDCKKLSVN